MAGALLVVATPIGNLGDLSPRALEALSTADLVCCEDTRRTGKLFEHLGVEHRPPFLRLDEHREAARAREVVDRIAAGGRVAVVTDAGTPGISDPGERVVSAVLAAGLPVDVLPGPSAVVTALIASGLPTGRFVFEGFLPRRGGARDDRLATLAAERRTIVLYEAPHRVARTLADLAAACGGDRRAAVARELTKVHQEVRRGSLGELAAWAGAEEPRGELVVVVEGAPEPEAATDAEVVAALRAALAAGLSTRDAAAAVAADLGVAKRLAYARALEL